MQRRSVVATVALMLAMAAGAGATAGRAAAQADGTGGAAAPPESPGQRIGARASVGFWFETGDYGVSSSNNKTDIWTVPLTLRIDVDDVTLSVATSWLRTAGPATAVGTGSAAGPGSSQSAQGLGDTTVGLSIFHFWSEPWSARYLPDVELRATVKIPTADEDKLLGTGEVDFALQAELSQQFGATTVFAGGGYRWVGGPLRATRPGGGTLEIDLENAWLASVGATVDLGRRGQRWFGLMIGLAYDYRESTVSGVGSSHELSPYAQVDLGSAVALSPSLVIGLSRSSPEIGAGTQLTVRY